MMNLNPAYICLFVHDQTESVKFYHDVLGLTPVSELETKRFKPFRFGSIILGIEASGTKNENEKAKAENPYILQFTVNSYEELTVETKRLKNLGVKLVEVNKEYGFAYVTAFLDPDGNRLELLFLKPQHLVD